MGNGIAWHRSYQVFIGSARSGDIGWLGFPWIFNQEGVRIGAGFVMACMRLCIPPFFACAVSMEDGRHGSRWTL